jgi:hypothetical protein
MALRALSRAPLAAALTLAVAACGPSSGGGAHSPTGASGGGGGGSGGKTCVADRGCPATAPIPPCEGRLAARPAAEILAQGPAAAPEEVIVAGVLQRGGIACTEKECLEGLCCNRCDGQVRLYAETGPGTADLSKGLDPVARDPDRFACHGDDTGTCCGIADDGELVVVRGTLTGLQIRDARVCVP